MTTIGKSMFPVKSSFQHIASMKARYNALQRQLATGQRAANLAEMGSNRFFDLSMRARLSKIDAYSETMKAVDFRLEVLDVTISRLDEIEAKQRTSITPGAYGTGNINFSTVPTLSLAAFDEVMTLLNADVGGRYLFGGGLTDKKPVVSPRAALDGEGGKAGFRTVASERKLADLGTTLMGRVTVAAPADTVTLAEDADHPFGFKLSSVAASTTHISVVQPGGLQPRSLTVQFDTANLPLAGDRVTIVLSLPDGTTESIELKATNSVTPEPGEFQIGADADQTATNFAAALTDAVELMAGTKLAAASTYAAAENFFNGRGEAVMRVDGPPYDTATALVAATPADTVLWYVGEDSADPRSSVNAKVDDGTTVNYGVQANETGLIELVRTLASMAITTYSDADATSPGRFDAMALRQIDRLAEGNSNNDGSIGVIAVELGLAKTTMGHVGERQTAHKAQLDSMLADIENIPPEEVAMEILALKTRLEASFETTSLVAQLSLVHYLP